MSESSFFIALPERFVDDVLLAVGTNFEFCEDSESLRDGVLAVIDELELTMVESVESLTTSCIILLVWVHSRLQLLAYLDVC
mmetsp:Transcript_41840/g.98036  ORF Transcript_41840/g.98036 Transcript_41840/m.98036 type:complete len:82 (-) Transcript_41840:202-447(-)